MNVNIGNMLGDQIGGLIIDTLGYNWGWLMLIVAAVELLVCVILLLFLKPYPEKVGCVIHEFAEDSKEAIEHQSNPSKFTIKFTPTKSMMKYLKNNKTHNRF